MRHAIVLALTATVLGCGADFGPDHAVRSASLHLEDSALSLKETRTLTPLFLNASGEVLENVRGVTWHSSDPTIASVDGAGHLTGENLGGPVTISVSAHGSVATATVNVIPDRIIFSHNISSLILGHTVQLAGTAADFNGDAISASLAPVRWSSGTPSIASVDDATGVVTALSAGEVMIYATAAGRTNGLHIETGNPSAYDGIWSGESSCVNCQYPTTYPVTFDVFFGRVKTFRLTVTGPPPFVQCGAGGEPVMLTPPTGSPNSVVRDDQFMFTLVPDVTTISGTFTSAMSATGSYTSMNIPVVCRNNILAVPALAIAAGTFTATRQ